MRKRTLLATGLILFGLLFAMVPVNAASLTPITDPTGDVTSYDYNENMTIAHSNQYINVSNIDIVAATCNYTGTAVTVTLRVNGVIEDRGHINDITMEGFDNLNEGDYNNLTFDTIGYVVNVSTDANVYTITYVNNTCRLGTEDSTNFTPITTFSKKGNTVTMSFVLNSSAETIEGFGAQTTFLKMNFSEVLSGEGAGMYMYMDYAPNDPLTIQDAGTDQNLAATGTTISFTCTLMPSTGQPPYSYHWNFGDGQTTSTPNTPALTNAANHVYNKAGTYTYNCTVTDNSGFSQYQTGSIKINSQSTSVLPGIGNMVMIFIAIIVIIAIAGVAIVIYLIRR